MFDFSGSSFYQLILISGYTACICFCRALSPSPASNIIGRHECFAQSSWMQDAHEPFWHHHCYNAAQQLQQLAVRDPSTKRTFSCYSTSRAERLPITFGSGECKIVVMMFIQFPRDTTLALGVTPSPNLRPYPRDGTDRASWSDIWLTSTIVTNLCVWFSTQHLVTPAGGYAQTGDHGQIGVFFFASGSRLDRAIPRQMSSLTNLTFPSPSLASRDSTNVPGREECFSDNSWIQDWSRSHWIDDCNYAAVRFWSRYGAGDVRDPIWFSRRRSQGTEHLPILTRNRGCVLAVIMFADFPSSIKPAPHPAPYPHSDSDQASWQDIFGAALSVSNRCALSMRGGYKQTGKNGNIGVFLWGSDSDLDQEVRPLLGIKSNNNGSLAPPVVD